MGVREGREGDRRKKREEGENKESVGQREDERVRRRHQQIVKKRDRERERERKEVKLETGNVKRENSPKWQAGEERGGGRVWEREDGGSELNNGSFFFFSFFSPCEKQWERRPLVKPKVADWL